MFTHDLDLDKVSVKQPKRYDNFMSGKVVYDDDEKLIIDLPRVKLISVKSSNETLYCKFKLTREQEKFIMDLEERLVNVTIANVSTWFKSRMNKDTVDEYFASALNFNKKVRSLFKLRIESPTVTPEVEWAGEFVDIKIRVGSLRFLKTSWWACYDLIECVLSKELVSFQTDDEDDNVSVIAIEDDIAGPDGEVQEMLRQKYLSRLQEEATVSSERLRRIDELVQILKNGCYSLSAFDAIENLLG